MKHILNTLVFYSKNPGWHTYGKLRTTKNAIKSLQKRGFLDVNEFRQAKLKNLTNFLINK